MTVGKPAPLLTILILIYIRNPLSLYTFPENCLTNGILIALYPYLLSCFFNAA